MKNLLVLGMVLGLSGCATTGMRSMTGGGWIANFQESAMVTSDTGNSKMGMACTQNILGVAIGDASLNAAKKNGGITRVSSVDYEVTNILFLYGKLCTVARGN